MSDVRVRFAPSPTGYLHIGGLRTALYNYLYAKQHGGTFVLRIEDTDRTRLVEDATKNLLEALEWAGIAPDEGVVLDENREITERGEYGPYIQSQRLPIYKKYVDRLVEEGHAYPCFCSKERLDHLREGQKIQGKVPKYDGLCAGISREEAQQRIDAGEEYVIRLRMPHNENISFHDAVRGDITINTNEIDDQVLLKSDGFPTYHLAVVVDDHLMHITHIVRGEEWLPSTPKHVMLYKALGWEAPEYVHLPTVLNKDRKKLSKRQGDVSVEDFRAKGYLPEGLVNYLALVGWSSEDNEEIFSLDDLVQRFSFERVAKAGGIFDKDKLDWVNAHWIKAMDDDALTELAVPYWDQAGLFPASSAPGHKEWLKKAVSMVKEGISRVNEIPEKTAFLFGNLPPYEDEAIAVLGEEQVPALLDALEKEVEQVDRPDEEFGKTVMKRIQKETGVKGKNLFMPIRAALTGALHGPEMVDVFQILGKKKMMARIQNAREIHKNAKTS